MQFYESVGDHPSPVVYARANKFDKLFLAFFNDPSYRDLPFARQIQVSALRNLTFLFKKENSFAKESAKEYESTLDVASVRSQE